MSEAHSITRHSYTMLTFILLLATIVPVLADQCGICPPSWQAPIYTDLTFNKRAEVHETFSGWIVACM